MTVIDKAEALAVLRKAQIASCTCQIKTPDPEWHSHNCRYRILREAEAMIDHLPDAALPARGVDVNPKAVRAAFQEGFVAGAQDGWLNNPRMDRDWKASRAKRELKR